MNLFEIIWPTIKAVLAIFGMTAAIILVFFICLFVYYYFLQCRLQKARVKTEDTMLDLMANFAVGIEIASGANRDKEVKRLEAQRDQFNKIVDAYYADPNNKPTSH